MNQPDLTTAPPSSANEIETVARQIAAAAREMSSEIDNDRRLPEELVALLGDSGLLRAGAPVEVRGLELPPGVALRCAEAVARGNASAGWCVSIAITSSLLVAYLPVSSREALFGDGRGVAAGVWAPRGTGRTVEGGVVVSGRWAFCSGITHADMMFAGCLVDDQRLPSVVALRKEDLRVLDTWHTLGLRGTGSHDAVADEVFVPADRVFSLFDGPILDRPLYRFPVFGFFALSIAAAALGNARGAIDDLVELACAKKGLGSTRTLAERPATQAAVATAESALSAARALYYEAIEAGWQASQDGEGGVGRDAKPLASGGNSRGAYLRRRGPRHVRPRRRQRDIRQLPAAATIPRRVHRHRSFPGQRGIARAAWPDPARSAGRRVDAVTGRIEVALPFWLDRPDEEALDIALAAREAGFETLWIGEMATYDAFALATAVGHRAPGLRLKLGPLALGVRSPVALALGASSVASLTGSKVDIALGASSPAIVAGWHDRQWAQHASRMRETIECLRTILAGTRVDYTGQHVRSRGFRLRKPMPDSRIAVGAFGPAMTRVAARHADEVVLNLVPPARVADMRAIIDAEAAAAGRIPPRLTVWVPVAVNPGDAALGQLAAQLAVYLAPPGYGEMFSELGFLDLVQRARAGARRVELATAVPVALLDQVCALGSPEGIAARLQAYHDAGADTVAIVPSTAEDPCGAATLNAVALRHNANQEM